MDIRLFFPVIFSMIMIALLSGVETVLLRRLHPDWWRHRWVRRLSRAVPLAGLASLLLWTVGIFTAWWLVLLGAYLTATVMVTGIALMISLPFSAILHGIASLLAFLRRGRQPAPVPPGSPARRDFLKTAAAVFPVVAVAAGGIGVAGALRRPITPELPLRFPGLPEALDGLRILQISDVHIGYFVTPQDFEAMAGIARAARPDLVLITGDLSDYIDVYGAALRTAAAIEPPYGVYASIGNHEYYTGIRPVLREYDRGPIPLLLDAGTTLRIRGAELYLAGADDPRTVSGYDPAFLPRTIDAAVAGAPSGAFVLLMSHRPEGFDHAARLGIPLTLSGHTHGGQLGFRGRSLMDDLFGRRYMWGLYRQGASTLYTTAGAGHWFPYRIGCPAEMPVYVLRRGT